MFLNFRAQPRLLKYLESFWVREMVFFFSSAWEIPLQMYEAL